MKDIFEEIEDKIDENEAIGSNGKIEQNREKEEKRRGRKEQKMKYGNRETNTVTTDIVIPKTKEELQIVQYCDILEANKKKSLKLIANTDFENDFLNPETFICTEVLTPCKISDIFGSNGYKPKEVIEKAYDAFKQMIVEINKKTIYVPTLNSFCQFIGTTRTHFMSMCNEVNERGDLCCFIKQSFEEMLLQSAMTNRVEKLTAMFTLKSIYQLRDSDAPQVNIMNVSTDRSVDDILSDLNKNIE